MKAGVGLMLLVGLNLVLIYGPQSTNPAFVKGSQEVPQPREMPREMAGEMPREKTGGEADAVSPPAPSGPSERMPLKAARTNAEAAPVMPAPASILNAPPQSQVVPQSQVQTGETKPMAPAPAVTAQNLPSPPAAPLATPAVTPVMEQPPAVEKVPDAVRLEDDRAKELLAAEERRGTALHPLQKASPDDAVTVCEAGCGDERAHVIMQKPKTLVRSAVTATLPATELVTNAIECKGGCGYPVTGALPVHGASKLLADQSGAWMTSVTPTAQARPKTSKALRDDWMARINRERATDTQVQSN